VTSNHMSSLIDVGDELVHNSAIVSPNTSRTTARNLFLAVAFLVALIAAAPLFTNSGLLNTRGGGDSPFLLQRLHQLTRALGDGHFPVRWMPDANYGYGYPFYNYYAPLSIYIAALFRFLGASYVLAIKLAQLAGFIVAAWGMFSLGRRWLGNNWAALLAAAAYTLAPFHMVNVYVRGDSLAEFWAMAFYPLVILGVDRLLNISPAADPGMRRARRIGVALLALVYAALVLSHNISALIFTPFLLLYLAYELWDRRKAAVMEPGVEIGNAAETEKSESRSKTGQTILWLALALTLALALAAWFWLPALAESSLAQLEPVTKGYFHYSNHFRDSDLVQRSLTFSYDPDGGRVFSMGLVQALGILLGTAGLLLTGRWQKNVVSRGHQLFIVSGLILATIMITSLSLWLWDNLPLLSFTQFPWRFLSVQAFFGALATGGLALLPGRRLIVPLAIALLLFSALFGLRLDFLKLADGDITAQRLAEYEWYSGNIGTTVSAEYLPETVQPRPQTSRWLNSAGRNEAQVLQGQAPVIEPLTIKTARQEWRIVAGEDGATVLLPTMAWPGWQGWLDDQEQAIETAAGSGLITVHITPGEHRLELKLTRTPVRMVGEIVALFALVICTWLVVSASKAHRPDRRAWAIVAGAVLLIVLLQLWPEPKVREDDLNWDFAQMAYLHHADDGIEFDNGNRLDGYGYDREEVTAGEMLQVTLNWAEGAAGQATLELVTPAVNRTPRATAFSRQTQEIQGGPVTYVLAVPDNAPAGAAVLRLVVDGAQPLTQSGLSRGDLFLRPLQVRDTPEPTGEDESSAGTPLDARLLSATMRDDRLLDLQIQWLTRQVLDDNYNFSLRLVDGNGVEVAQQDGQPGFGFLPSSTWPVDRWTDDWIGMAMREETKETAAVGPLDLVVRLYDVTSGEVVLTRLLGQVALQADQFQFSPVKPVFEIGAVATPLAAGFGPIESGMVLNLSGYELSQDGDLLNLTLYWSAQEPGQKDLYRFVHIEDTGNSIVAQHDGMPRHNSYPTSQWVKGEVVADSMQIDLGELPAGEYRLYTGLYGLTDGEALRVPIAVDGGLAAADDRLLLPDVISIGP
jgi:hypothetical protein